MEWVLAKTVLSLGLVLGLMFGLVFVLKRYVLPGRVKSAASIEIDVLAQRTLQPRRSVMVLKVLNKVLVVGMTEQGMTLLTEIADGASLAELEEKLSATDRGPILWPAMAGGKSFSEQFNQYKNLISGRKGRRAR
jgi:flagellar protein FliO/FliZ